MNSARSSIQRNLRGRGSRTRDDQIRERQEASGRVVEAEEFVVRDKRGRKRGRLGLLADGSVGFELLGRKGVSRARLSVSKDDHVCLRLNDPKGRTRAMFGVCHHEGPFLILFDRDGEQRMRVNLHHVGIPDISLRDRDGAPRVNLFLYPDGNPQFSIDRDGRNGGDGNTVSPEGHLERMFASAEGGAGTAAAPAPNESPKLH